MGLASDISLGVRLEDGRYVLLDNAVGSMRCLLVRYASSTWIITNYFSSSEKRLKGACSSCRIQQLAGHILNI